MKMPQYLEVDLQPWFEDTLEVSSVSIVDRGLVCFIFGVFRQWAVTWNETIHLTKRAPFILEPTGVVSRRDGTESTESYANALWLISHECLHIQQQREMGWWRFSFAYGRQWVRHRGGSSNKFEGPAYELGDRVYQDFMRRLA